MIALALVVLLFSSSAGENRLWWVELELHGPCESVRLDCGASGSTRLTGPFVRGEAQRLVVPVPMRSPLGVDGLRRLALPSSAVLPAGAEGTAVVLGWSPEQTSDRLRAVAHLRNRPWPVARETGASPAPAELLLALVAGGFVLALRRRTGRALLLALGTAALGLYLARGRHSASVIEHVLEWTADSNLALAVTVAGGELDLPRGGLEVSPEGAHLEFVLTKGGGGRAHAPGARLAGLELRDAPALTGARNDEEALPAVWTRAGRGSWLARGPWGRGEPLPPVSASGGADPPGWLAGGLPPGRPVLLGRSERGRWFRCLGFEPETDQAARTGTEAGGGD